MNDVVGFLPIIAIALVFWLLIIRPAARRQRETLALQAALSVGDEVILTSGVFATIVETADDHLEAEIAPGVRIRIVRGAVASVRREVAEPQSEESATDSTDNDAEER